MLIETLMTLIEVLKIHYIISAIQGTKILLLHNIYKNTYHAYSKLSLL